ncbi:MAG: DUF5069 domain-containing protein [Vulcanimicrobiaceae bacterium]
MEKIVPLISSTVAGPLGVLHLPRLWLKILLHAADALPEGYRHGTGGFDEFLCNNLGLEPAELIAFIATERPSYSQCEAWVKTHATKLDPESIAWHNIAIRTRNMGEQLAADRRATLNIADPTFANATTLNDLDDWNGVHAQIVERSKD